MRPEPANPRPVKTLGLTGGVGMGKSTCAELLRQRGLLVVDTDDLARAFTQPGQPALAEIHQAFGTRILDESGQLRRDLLAELVFNDRAALRQLEAILHPRITGAWRDQVARWGTQGAALAVVVIPLLFETGAEGGFDAAVCVACSTRTQHSRLQARGWSDVEIERRSAAQLNVAEKIARSRFVIWSEGSLASHAAQLERILQAA